MAHDGGLGFGLDAARKLADDGDHLLGIPDLTGRRKEAERVEILLNPDDSLQYLLVFEREQFLLHLLSSDGGTSCKVFTTTTTNFVVAAGTVCCCLIYFKTSVKYFSTFQTADYKAFRYHSVP